MQKEIKITQQKTTKSFDNLVKQVNEKTTETNNRMVELNSEQNANEQNMSNKIDQLTQLLLDQQANQQSSIERTMKACVTVLFSNQLQQFQTRMETRCQQFYLLAQNIAIKPGVHVTNGGNQMSGMS